MLSCFSIKFHAYLVLQVQEIIIDTATDEKNTQVGIFVKTRLTSEECFALVHDEPQVQNHSGFASRIVSLRCLNRGFFLTPRAEMAKVLR